MWYAKHDLKLNMNRKLTHIDVIIQIHEDHIDCCMFLSNTILFHHKINLHIQS